MGHRGRRLGGGRAGGRGGDSVGEQGLLGLAFHPDYATNGLFYVYLSTPSGDAEVRRYQVSAGDPNRADAATAQRVTAFDYPATSANHRAGWIGFGPDDMLYVATGDGGIDPGNAQRLDTPLGKILRLDIDADAFPADPDRNYAVPADNPSTIDGIAGSAAGTGFYAAGLRNPFRDGFDRGLGDLFIGNVGQASFEEINLGRAGANYGWPATEGFFDQAAFPSFTQPIHAYAHGSGASVTGGYVYRGESEGLHGQYFFADFVTGQVWTLRFNGGAWTPTERTGQISPDFGQINNPSSFGEDARGNLYLVDFDGDIFRLTPQVASADQGDDLRGGGGDDMVFAGSGADRVFGEAGRDALDGGPGDDLLDGGEGADQIFGGAGADTVSYLDAPRAVLINLHGQAAADGIDTDMLSSIENAIGSAFNDTIIGDAGANVLDGGREGSDQIFGAGGLDTVSYATSRGPCSSTSPARSRPNGINTDTLSSIENAIGSAFDDTIIGDAGPNVLDGGLEGSDRIFGGGDLDTVSYAASPRAVLINLTAQLTADGINTDTLSSIENAIGSGFDDVILSSDASTGSTAAAAATRCPTIAGPRAVLINLAARRSAEASSPTRWRRSRTPGLGFRGSHRLGRRRQRARRPRRQRLPSCSSAVLRTATPSSISAATARPRRRLRVRRLRPRRDLRSARRHALAGQLRRRNDPRDHHPAERRRRAPRRRALRLTRRARALPACMGAAPEARSHGSC